MSQRNEAYKYVHVIGANNGELTLCRGDCDEDASGEKGLRDAPFDKGTTGHNRAATACMYVPRARDSQSQSPNYDDYD